MEWIAVVAIGIAVGFLGGLFGKGGSALATPLLHAAGIPAIVALAAPLPATIPGTFVASLAYWRVDLVDREVFRWGVVLGVPATIVGAELTRWIGGGPLVLVTDVVVAGLGLRFLLAPRGLSLLIERPEHFRARLVVVSLVAGLAGGVLANSGGFLLAPLYMAVLRLPVKKSFACSLAVASVLAVPGTGVHWALGHLDWNVVGAFALGAVPLSWVGARVAVHTEGVRLERVYGGVLTFLGVTLLVAR